MIEIVKVGDEKEAERSVLASCIYRDAVLAFVSGLRKNPIDLFYNRISCEIVSWCIAFYNKYGKAPKEDIVLFITEKLKQDEEFGTRVAEFIQTLFIPSTENDEYLIELAMKFFDEKGISDLIKTLQNRKTNGDIVGCVDAINGYSRVARNLSEGVNPTEEKVIEEAFNDSTLQSLITFPTMDESEFFGDTFSRGSFVVINAPEKAGKCIAGSERVLCGDGETRTIEEIVTAKMKIDVVAVDFARLCPIVVPISNWYCNGEKHCYRVTTDVGKTILCTKEHLLYTQSRGWFEAGELNVGDSILTSDTRSVQWERILRVEYVGEEKVYDIEIPNHHNFVVNGIVAHNSSLLLAFAVRAVSQGKSVAYFEAGDMSKNQLLRRLYCLLSRTPRKPGTYQYPIKLELVEDEKSGLKVNVDFENICCSKKLDADKVKEVVSSEYIPSVKKPGSFTSTKQKPWTELVDGKWKLSFHSQDLTVPEINTILDEWERIDGFIPDFIIIDYADILVSVSHNKEVRHQINDTFMRLRALSLARKCCLLTATQANQGAWGSDTMTRVHLSEDKRKAAHPTAIIGLNSSQYERDKQVVHLNYLVRRDDVCNESNCLYLAQCLNVCNPWVLAYYPPYRDMEALNMVAKERQAIVDNEIKAINDDISKVFANASLDDDDEDIEENKTEENTENQEKTA